MVVLIRIEQMPRQHILIDLELRQDKPNAVYRYVDHMEATPANHNPGGTPICYLFVDAYVQWNPELPEIEHVLFKAIQYSAVLGHRVDVSQPAHVQAEDAVRVEVLYLDFVRRCLS
jgi:hypothetical protein